MFYQGFFLGRRQILDRSNILESPAPGNVKYWSDEHVQKKKNRKLVILLFDALRFDFALQMHSIMNLTSEIPERARLFKFVADAPTTTMQRLKALTTGTLPTFIDAASNFDSSEIIEDNLIEQMVSAGKKVVFMGDDTWLKLYPRSFHRAFPYPSFNVKDLDTVDNGCVENLFEEIRKPDWDVVIAHFLGIDHAGHRFSAGHSEIYRKIRQFDGVVKDTVDEIEKKAAAEESEFDYTLVVMGDHGMTEDGNHGGSTDIETNAALFVLSSDKFMHTNELRREVDQVDIVPTISRLLQIPIPFCSIGKIIHEVMPSISSFEMCKAIRTNTWQIFKYFETYLLLDHSHSFEAEFSSMNETLLHMEFIFSGLNVNLDSPRNHSIEENTHQHLLNTYKSEIHKIGRISREKWASFNEDIMILSLLFQFISVISLGILIIMISNSHANIQIDFPFAISMFIGAAVGFYLFLQFKDWTVLLATILIFPIFQVSCKLIFFGKERIAFLENIRSLLYIPSNLISIIILIAYFQGFFSNSFIVRENELLFFLCFSLFCVLTVNGYMSHGYSAALSVISLIFINLFGMNENGFGPEKLAPEKIFTFTHLCTTLISMLFICVYFVVKIGFSNLQSVMCCLNSLVLAIHWFIQYSSIYAINLNVKFVSKTLAKFVLVSPLFQFIWFFRKAYAARKQNSLDKIHISSFEVISIIYPLLSILHGSKFPIIFLSFIFLCQAISPISSDSVKCYSNLILFHAKRIKNKLMFDVSLIIYAWLFSLLLFFSSGHRCEFSKLQITSAFVGFDSFNYWRSGALLILNTFSAPLLGNGIALLISNWNLIITAKDEKDESERNQRDTFTLLVRPMAIHLFLYCLRCALTCINAYDKKRHLMVWDIFAPKFVFDACMYIANFVYFLIFSGIAYSIHERIVRMRS
jgi:hypothetical protein